MIDKAVPAFIGGLAASVILFFASLVGVLPPAKDVVGKGPATAVFIATNFCAQGNVKVDAPALAPGTANSQVYIAHGPEAQELHLTSAGGVAPPVAVWYHQVMNPATKATEQVSETVDATPGTLDCLISKAGK